MSKIQYIDDSKKSYKIINNKPIAVYIRVSTEHETQRESLVNQKEYFDQIIGKDKYDLFCDEGLSAAIKLDKRLAFEQLLNCCGVEIKDKESTEDEVLKAQGIPPKGKRKRKGKVYVVTNSKTPIYKYIYIKSTSRFVRHFIGESILSELKEKKVTVIAVQNNLDSSKDSDWVKLLAAINTDTAFSKNLSENVKFSFNLKANKGMLPNVRYYGTRPIKKGKYIEKYEIIEEEARAIQLIYEWYLNGIVDDNGNIISQPLGFKAIATELNKRGYQTLYGKPWHQGTVQKLMANEKYKGFYNGGKYDGSRIDNPERNSSKIRDDYKVFPHDGIPAIVTPEIWDACAEKRKQKEIAITRTESTNQSTKYGGLIYCGLCGNKYKHNKTLREKKKSLQIKEIKSAVTELVTSKVITIPENSIFNNDNKVFDLVFIKDSKLNDDLSTKDKNNLNKLIKYLKSNKPAIFNTPTQNSISTNNMVGYYVCKTKKELSVAKCSNHNVLDEQLEELISHLCNGGYASEIELDFIHYIQLQVFAIGVQFEKLTKKNVDTSRISKIKNELNRIDNEMKAKMSLFGIPGLDDNYTTTLLKKLGQRKLTLNDELEKLQITPSKSINKIELCFSNIENLLKEHTQIKKTYTQREILDKIAKIVVYPDSKYDKPNRYSKPILRIIYKNQLESKDDLGFEPMSYDLADYNLDLSLIDDDNDFKNVPYLKSFKNKKKQDGSLDEEDGLIIEMGTLTGRTIQQQIQDYLTRQKLKLEKFKEVL